MVAGELNWLVISTKTDSMKMVWITTVRFVEMIITANGLLSVGIDVT